MYMLTLRLTNDNCMRKILITEDGKRPPSRVYSRGAGGGFPSLVNKNYK